MLFSVPMWLLFQITAHIGWTTYQPHLLGSAFITKGYFKVDALPHPFENITADFLFSQSRVLLNRFKGIFGGGQLTAGGSILFQGHHDIPAEISGDLTH